MHSSCQQQHHCALTLLPLFSRTSFPFLPSYVNSICRFESASLSQLAAHDFISNLIKVLSGLLPLKSLKDYYVEWRKQWYISFQAQYIQSAIRFLPCLTSGVFYYSNVLPTELYIVDKYLPCYACFREDLYNLQRPLEYLHLMELVLLQKI